MFMKILDRLEEALIASLMAVATLIIFVAVVHRFASGIPFLYPYAIQLDFGWAQELCIFLFVWMAKFGAAYGVRVGIHVGVDVLVNRLDQRWRGRFIIIALLAGALFTGVIGTLGAKLVLRQYGTSQVSPDMELPAWLVHLAIPLGSYLMCFRFLQVAYHFVRTGETPHRDHGRVAGVEPEGTP